MTNQFETLSEAINDLSQRGYKDGFVYKKEGKKICTDTGCFLPEDLKIVEHHRFEGDSDPADMAVVYAIESRSGAKGIIIDAFGAYADAELGEFIKKIRVTEDPSN